MVDTLGDEHLVNGQAMTPERGALVFMRPRDCHALWCRRGPASVVNVIYRAGTVQALRRHCEGQCSGPFFWSDGPLPIVMQLSPPDRIHILRDLHRLLNGPRTAARMGVLIQTMLSVRAEEPLTGDLPTWLVESLGRIDFPVLLRQGARELSDDCGKTHEHACRVGSWQMNRTASDLMNERRMAFAARQLLASGVPVSTIAELCGIENESYFHRLFRTHHEMTPNEYRSIDRRDPVNLL